MNTRPAVGRITTLSPTSGCGAGVSVGRGVAVGVGCTVVTGVGVTGTVRTTRTAARGVPGDSTSNVCSPGSRFTVTAHAPWASALVCPTAVLFRYTVTDAFGSVVPRSSTVAASVVESGAGDVIATGAVPASNAPASQAGPIGRAMP